jgi:putative DNA primase/helicase
LTIDRKHKEPITAKLNSRFVILSNELPRLGDASGALAGRLILLRLTHSWYGQEDHHLFDRLRGELPGILNWAIEGWKRLRDRGRFLQPASGRELMRDMEDLASPIGRFVRERCVVEDGARVEKGELFGEWKRWCDEHGRKEPGTDEKFSADLAAAVPTLGRSRPRTSEGRIHVYTGIRIRTESDPETDEDDEVVRVRSGCGQGGGQCENAGNSSVVSVVSVNASLMRVGEEQTQQEEALRAIEGAMRGHPDHTDQPDQSTPFPEWLRTRLSRGPAREDVLVTEGVVRGLTAFEARDAIAAIGAEPVFGHSGTQWRLRP